MSALQQLSPEDRAQVATEWRTLRERPTSLPVEDCPPVVVRGSDQSVRRVEMAEVGQ